MTITGHIENGTIVLDEPVALPEGALVKIELAEDDSRATSGEASVPFAERYSAFIGALDGLPKDWAEDHDRYLRDEHGA